jgi:hypothetical protein
LVRFVLGLVGGGIGSRIDDELRLEICDGSRERRWIGEVSGRAAGEPDSVAARRAFAAESLRHLTVFADDENPVTRLRH